MKLVDTNSFKIAINEYGDPNAKRFALLLPGRLDTKDYANFISHGNFFAGLGYHVVAIDPPYTWESPGDLHGYTTSAYLQCVNELIEHFGNKETILLGHSRGGATAMLATPNTYVKAVVLVNAAYGSPSTPDKSKLVDGYLPEARDLLPGNVRTKEQVKFMLPMNYFVDGDKHNPVKALEDFSGAKLLIHATADEFCGADEVEKIYDRLSDPKEFLAINCTHDYRLFPEVIDEVNNAVQSFLKRNNLI